MMSNPKLDTKTIRYVEVPVTDFKMSNPNTGEFTCYANVKNLIDYAGDRTVDGCFVQTIADHKKNNTMPLMLWMHNPYELPVGVWIDWEEDEKGLLMKGKLSSTTMGKDLQVLAKDGAIKKFSIGYRIEKGRWNDDTDSYDLLSVDVKEVSWVNFACNDESDLQDIKNHIDDGNLPTKRELQSLLRKSGLSKRQAERISNKYNPEYNDKIDAVSDLAKYLTENNIRINM